MKTPWQRLAAVLCLSVLGYWPAGLLAQTGDALPDEDAVPGVEINDDDPQQALDRQFNLDPSELSGVIVNRTMTMAGKTFYRSFAQASMQSPVLNDVVLTVHERPDPRWGSQLWITEGNRVHFRTQLSPRISEADRNARAAVNTVQESIISARVSEALQPSRDLADEEF
ncbi:MAG: CsgE family curli-type amyloid fiber assembly protein [Pseudomonadota bacterium]